MIHPHLIFIEMSRNFWIGSGRGGGLGPGGLGAEKGLEPAVGSTGPVAPTVSVYFSPSEDTT